MTVKFNMLNIKAETSRHSIIVCNRIKGHDRVKRYDKRDKAETPTTKGKYTGNK
nr:hypothetical protein [Candidatus Magnetominusculus xianensis]